MVLFAVGSLVAGAAGTEEVLVAGRVLQGVGGAALLSLSLALTTAAFPPELQPRALGIWAAVSAVALAIGPLVGGVLIEAASWRWIFFINLPVAVAGIVILTTRGEESRDPSASRVDLAGVAVLAAGLATGVLALVQADEWSFISARRWRWLAVSLALLVGFWILEHRREAPLVDFSLFRNRPYLGATAAAFALVGAYWVVMFFQPQYLQEELGYGAVAAGALILPVTVPMAVFSPFSGRLIAAFGPRATMTVGMLFGLAGIVLQALTVTNGSYAAMIPGFACFGISLALVYAPMSTAAMAAMPGSKCGIASGRARHDPRARGGGAARDQRRAVPGRPPVAHPRRRRRGGLRRRRRPCVDSLGGRPPRGHRAHLALGPRALTAGRPARRPGPPPASPAVPPLEPSRCGPDGMIPPLS